LKDRGAQIETTTRSDGVVHFIGQLSWHPI